MKTKKHRVRAGGSAFHPSLGLLLGHGPDPCALLPLAAFTRGAPP